MAATRDPTTQGLLKQLAALSKQVATLTKAKAEAAKAAKPRKRAPKKEAARERKEELTKLAGYKKGEGCYIVCVGKSLNDQKQVFAIRAKERGHIGHAVLYAEAYWESPTKVVSGNALPDTQGITCWLETQGPIFCHKKRTRDGEAA